MQRSAWARGETAARSGTFTTGGDLEVNRLGTVRSRTLQRTAPAVRFFIRFKHPARVQLQQVLTNLARHGIEADRPPRNKRTRRFEHGDQTHGRSVRIVLYN
jgi:hypothetical protein